jgi:hypothetical protein
MAPTSAAAHASTDSALTFRSPTRAGYNVYVPDVSPLPRWVAPLLALVALFLVPWTLWLTFTLPARHITDRYDLAWVGFDIALAAAFAATAWAGVYRVRWLAPLAAATGTMLLCDAWFDIVTSSSGGEMVEAALEAALGELPLAALCTYIVLDVERFLTTFDRLLPTQVARHAELRSWTDDAPAERPEARARPDRHA